MLAAHLLLRKSQGLYNTNRQEGDRQVKLTSLNNPSDSGFKVGWKFLRAPEFHSPHPDLHLNLRVFNFISRGEKHGWGAQFILREEHFDLKLMLFV